MASRYLLWSDELEIGVPFDRLTDALDSWSKHGGQIYQMFALYTSECVHAGIPVGAMTPANVAALVAAAGLALKTIDRLADQQAMGDDFYFADVEVIKAALKPFTDSETEQP
jgi:hypothetical protein